MNKVLLLSLAALCLAAVCTADEPKKKSADEIAAELNQQLVYLQDKVVQGSHDPELNAFYRNIDVAIEKLKKSGLKKKPQH